MTRKQVLLMGGYLIGMASLVLQGCAGVNEQDRERLCGNWGSVAGKDDNLVLKEGESYQGTGFKEMGARRGLKRATQTMQGEDNGNLFINTGFRIDVAYNEAADVLTFSPGGDYVRKGNGQTDSGGMSL